MKRKIYYTVLLLVFVIKGKAQFTRYHCPQNGNAESNNFTNWVTYTGNSVNPQTNNSFVQAFDPQRFGVHAATGASNTWGPGGGTPLMLQGGVDTYGQFAIPNEGTYCFRVGNNNNGGEAEMMRFTFTVTDENKNFRFRYAVVLQDGGHPAGVNPSVVMYMTRGASIDPVTAADYVLYNATIRDVVADLNNPFFKQSPVQDDVVYKDWQCVQYDLSAYVGQVVSFCFRVRDCTQGGHFGYAYLDGLCTSVPAIASMTLNVQHFCPEQTVIMNAAPTTGEDSYFVEVAEVDATGNWVPNGVVVSQWFLGVQAPNGFDVTQFYANHGHLFECGKYYHVKLAVASGCAPWNDTEKIIKCTCPDVNAGKDSIMCCGETIQYDNFQIGESPQDGCTYSWTSIPSGFVSDQSAPIIDPSSSTAYIVTMTTQEGCIAKDTMIARFVPAANLISMDLEYKVCDPNPVGTVHLTPYGCENDPLFDQLFPHSEAVNAQWYFQYEDSPIWARLGKGETMVAPNAEGTLVVKYTHPCGGTIQASVPVHSVTPGSRDLIAPNAFTPDNGNFNNIFQILEFGPNAPYLGDNTPAYDAIDFKLRIWNRWGENFRTVTKADVGRAPDDALMQGDIQWDGKDADGVLVESGVYNYTLEMKYCGSSDFVRVRTPNGEEDACIRWVTIFFTFCVEHLSGWSSMVVVLY